MLASGTTLIDIDVSVGRPRSSFPVKVIGLGPPDAELRGTAPMAQ